MENVQFTSHGVTCAAWHIKANDQVGRPCVVMAHGFGGTRDSGLLAFAEAFATVGVDSFVFDYRGFGDSGGTPRQNVSYRMQRADYRAAIAAARTLPGVDPKRIGLWGTSYSGGHVVAAAAQDDEIAAVIAMNPATDGLAALSQAARYTGIGQVARAAAHGMLDLATTVAGRAHHVPVVGAPGSLAILTTSGSEQAYTAIAGPTWRNEVRARTALQIALNRPVRFASRISGPLLVQVGTNDRIAPPEPARRAAEKARHGQLLEYPVDHFDFFDGPWHRQVLTDQLAFLERTLT